MHNDDIVYELTISLVEVSHSQNLLQIICIRPFISVLHAHSSGHIVNPYANWTSHSNIHHFINILNIEGQKMLLMKKKYVYIMFCELLREREKTPTKTVFWLSKIEINS